MQVVEEYATKLKWVNGKPVVVGHPILDNPADGFKELLMQAMNLPYDGPDPRYVGLTKGEALIIDLVDQASQGDATARKEVLDRALGKPVQNIKSVSVRGTIEEFLDGLEHTSAAPVSPLEKAEVMDIDCFDQAEQEANDL